VGAKAGTRVGRSQGNPGKSRREGDEVGPGEFIRGGQQERKSGRSVGEKATTREKETTMPHVSGGEVKKRASVKPSERKRGRRRVVSMKKAWGGGGVRGKKGYSCRQKTRTQAVGAKKKKRRSKTIWVIDLK